MERRTFVQTSVASLCAAAAGDALAAEGKNQVPELYEMRVYSLKPAKQTLLDDYLSKALLPGLKRLGSGPVGVFVETEMAEELKVYVLIVHSSIEAFARSNSRLSGDEEYRKAAASYLDARASDPIYSRIESFLLGAIEGMPKLAKTDPAMPRLLNLRIYESHNERAAKKKIEMFNKGELAIFQRVGLKPVLFAETLIGSAMPNLTYLLVFPDEDGRKSAWDRFRGDAEWLKLRALPEYADKEIVSRITNKILTPTAYSEI